MFSKVFTIFNKPMLTWECLPKTFMVYSIQLTTWRSRYSAAYTGACLSSRYTSVLSLSSVFPASHWLRNCRLRSGALTWPIGMRYAAKLPVNSNISVATRVAAQLHAGRATLAEKRERLFNNEQDWSETKFHVHCFWKSSFYIYASF